MSGDREVPVAWGGDERRRTAPYTMRELEDHIDERIRVRLLEHAAEEARQINLRFDELKVLLESAFPGGDPEEHRRYHNEVMDWMRERRDLWRAIKEKTLTALLWSALVGLGAAVWQTVKAKMGGG